MKTFKHLMAREDGAHNQQLMGHDPSGDSLDIALLSAKFDSSFEATGAASLGSTLGVTGAATLSSTLDVSGAAALSSTLGVTGAATLASTLDVTGAATFASTLDVTGAFSGVDGSFSGTLDVTGVSTLGQTDVAVFSASGAASLGSTLDVTGAASLGSSLDVTGAATLSDTLDVTGALTGAAATFSGAVAANAGLSVSGGDLDIAADRQLTFGTAALIKVAQQSAGSSDYDLTIDPAALASGSGKVIILGDLQVQGTTTQIDSTTISVADLHIEVAKGAASLSAQNLAGLYINEGHGTDERGVYYGSSDDSWNISGTLFKAPALDIAGASTFNSITAGGAVVLNNNLTVSGLSALQAVTATDLNMSGNLVVAGTADVTGAVALNDTLSVAGAATLSSTLDVTGASTFDSISGASLTISGASSLQNASLSGTLDVTGAASLSSTLGVTGDASFSGAVSVATGNDLTVSDGLVAGTISSSSLPANQIVYPDANNKLISDSDWVRDASSQKVSLAGEFALVANSTSGIDPKITITDASGNQIFSVDTSGSSAQLASSAAASFSGAVTMSSSASLAEVNVASSAMVIAVGGQSRDKVEMGRHVEPSADYTYDLGFYDVSGGSSHLRWNNIYARAIDVESISAPEVTVDAINFNQYALSSPRSAADGDIWYEDGKLKWKDAEGEGVLGEQDLSGLFEQQLTINAQEASGEASLVLTGSDGAGTTWDAVVSSDTNYGMELESSVGIMYKQSGDSPSSFRYISNFDPSVVAKINQMEIMIIGANGLEAMDPASHYMPFGQAALTMDADAVAGTPENKYSLAGGHIEMKDREFGMCLLKSGGQAVSVGDRVYASAGGRVCHFDDIKLISDVHVVELGKVMESNTDPNSGETYLKVQWGYHYHYQN